MDRVWQIAYLQLPPEKRRAVDTFSTEFHDKSVSKKTLKFWVPHAVALLLPHSILQAVGIICFLSSATCVGSMVVCMLLALAAVVAFASASVLAIALTFGTILGFMTFIGAVAVGLSAGSVAAVSFSGGVVLYCCSRVVEMLMTSAKKRPRTTFLRVADTRNGRGVPACMPDAHELDLASSARLHGGNTEGGGLTPRLFAKGPQLNSNPGFGRTSSSSSDASTYEAQALTLPTPPTRGSVDRVDLVMNALAYSQPSKNTSLSSGLSMFDDSDGQAVEKQTSPVALAEKIDGGDKLKPSSEGAAPQSGSDSATGSLKLDFKKSKGKQQKGKDRSQRGDRIPVAAAEAVVENDEPVMDLVGLFDSRFRGQAGK